MDEMNACELAFKNGYEKGRAEALRYSSPGIPLSKEAQIKEMAQLMCHNEDGRLCDSFPCSLCPTHSLAEVLYNVGYRKIYDDHHKQVACYTLGCQEGDKIARQVAAEIFAEIEEMLNIQAKIVCKTREIAREADEHMLSFLAMLDGRIYSLRVVEEHIAELKKKYTGEGK